MPTRLDAIALHSPEQMPKLIRSLRKRKGWSQIELADKLNTTQQAISRMENDASGLSLKNLFSVLAVLEAKISIIDAHEPGKPESMEW